MDVPIHQVESPKFTAGHPAKLIAIVHHRMVGTLESTDTTFTTGSRVASTHFGIGLCKKHSATRQVCIHQYVRLGDQAFGNGNNRFDDGQLVASPWNRRNPTRLVNSRTISIEHHDNGGRRGPERGIVPEAVVEASIELDRLLLSGDLDAMTAAGIRFRAGEKEAIGRELRAMKPGRHTIVDHHYIAGSLKPHCWRPWRKDTEGFPRERFVAALRGTAARPKRERRARDPREEDGGPLKSFAIPARPTLASVRNDAWLYDNSALEASTRNVKVSPGREMPLIGKIGTTAGIVEYIKEDGTRSGKAFWLEAEDIEATRPAP